MLCVLFAGGCGAAPPQQRLAFDRDGRLYVVRARSSRILLYDSNLRRMHGATIRIEDPADVAFGPSGRLYVLTNKGQIRRRNAHGAFRTVLSGLGDAVSLAVDRNRNMLVGSGDGGLAVYTSAGRPVERLRSDGSGHHLDASYLLEVRGHLLYLGVSGQGATPGIHVYDEGALLRRDAQTFEALRGAWSGLSATPGLRGEMLVSDENGTIAEYGTHGQLLRRCPRNCDRFVSASRYDSAK